MRSAFKLLSVHSELCVGALTSSPPALLFPGEVSAPVADLDAQSAAEVLVSSLTAEAVETDLRLMNLTLVRCALAQPAATAVCAAVQRAEGVAALLQLLSSADAAVALGSCSCLRLLVPRLQDAGLRELCSSVLSTLAGGAQDAPPAAKRRRLDAGCNDAVAEFGLLKALLRDERQRRAAASDDSSDAPAIVADYLARNLSGCLEAASRASNEARAMHACSLAKSLLRGGADELSQEAARVLLKDVSEHAEALLSLLLPPACRVCSRHAGLVLLLTLLPRASDTSLASVCATALATHAADLLNPPPASLPSLPPQHASPFTPQATAHAWHGAGGALRRRALLVAMQAALFAAHSSDGLASLAAVAPPDVLSAWRQATCDDGACIATAAACVWLYEDEDDLLVTALATAADLAAVSPAAARLCCPCRLLALLLRSVRCDASVLLDLLLASASGLPLLRFLLAASRAAEAQPMRWRAALRAAHGGPDGQAAAQECLRALRSSVARLTERRLFPFNAAPLLHRLDALE